MKKIGENTKVTLTFEQLKKLVKEEAAPRRGKYKSGLEQAADNLIAAIARARDAMECLSMVDEQGLAHFIEENRDGMQQVLDEVKFRMTHDGM